MLIDHVVRAARRRPIRRASLLAACLCAAAPLPVAADQVAPAAPAATQRPAAPLPAWQAMLAQDLDDAAAFVRAQYISAVYPTPGAFERRLSAAMDEARAMSGRVTDFAGYRAVLKRFLNAFDDDHVGVAFAINRTRLAWPGFVVRYIGGRYVVAAAEPSSGARDGEVVTACDGTSLDELAARVAVIEGGHPGLESTRSSAATALMVDQANPFLPRPQRCTVAGHDLTLRWSRLAYADYLAKIRPLTQAEDRQVGITPFDSDGAWVRLGYFQPDGPAEAAALRKVIDAAPALRDKAVVVIDVRQNGGGPYDWMIAFIRALYGAPYADRYARARLAIRPVYRATPEVLAFFRAGDAADHALGTPADAATQSDGTRGVAAALARGEPVFHAAPPTPTMPEGPPPSSPVKGQVLVLTDYGCASVCIGFVDEMKRFPGVRQVGVETAVDSRTGTPLDHPLPSGNATVYAAVMTRDGRERGDNVPQRPDLVFPGDWRDTAALRAWIARVVRAPAR